MPKLTKISILLTALLMLGACNTIHGIGRDVESVGDTVADEAKD
ncbi:entericidin A/B family lipoprotein [Kordiimonas pumila]|uniref:Entericidin A/B family lipoprotein n=1 Tax=Kordiimonas pumila TaxID=2161677 RepID=A0ABV7D498_9PROT|nr:entericidin A/B family lipoprotein [Kordiimonas pumila]